MKLKTSLLYEILTMEYVNNRYSKSFLILKNIISIENDLPINIVKDFENIEKEYKNFLNEIPLIIVERYYNLWKDNPNHSLYIEYRNLILEDIKTIDVFLILEEFFNLMFNLAVRIADFYNIEIKINVNKENSTKKFI